MKKHNAKPFQPTECLREIWKYFCETRDLPRTAELYFETVILEADNRVYLIQQQIMQLQQQDMQQHTVSFSCVRRKVWPIYLTLEMLFGEYCCPSSYQRLFNQLMKYCRAVLLEGKIELVDCFGANILQKFAPYEALADDALLFPEIYKAYVLNAPQFCAN